MEPLQKTLREVMDKLKAQSKSAAKEDPQRLLKKFFTKQELEHSRINYLKKGVLSIKVDSSSWLYHLSLKKEGLLKKLREHNPQIKEMRFHLGEL